jgi:hypothetical protein
MIGAVLQIEDSESKRMLEGKQDKASTQAAQRKTGIVFEYQTFYLLP